MILYYREEIDGDLCAYKGEFRSASLQRGSGFCDLIIEIGEIEIVAPMKVHQHGERAIRMLVEYEASGSYPVDVAEYQTKGADE